MSIWEAALLAAWVMLLVNLGLTLRVVRWLRAGQDVREQIAERQRAPDLALEAPAPGFRARTLAGAAVGLDDYRGRPVTFVFVSPECPACRREMRALVRLASVAREKAGVDLVLVSDFDGAATVAWLRSMSEDDRVRVDLPVLVAPPAVSDFVLAYNPRGVTPFHCFVTADGTVGSRGPVGAGEWLKLRGSWEGATMSAGVRRLAR